MAGTIAKSQVAIAGGSRGIGLGFIRRLLLERDGNVIHATARQPRDAAGLHELQRAHPGRLHVYQLDVQSLDSIRAWAQALKQQTPHIDVLINNAGVYGSRVPFLEFTPEDFRLNFETNAQGPFFTTQQLVAAGLLGPPHSLVVNISSIMSSHGDITVSSVTGGGYAYRSSKAALNAINKALAMDLAPQHIDCVLLHPGYVKTDMTGGNGWVDVEESTQGMLRVLESGQPLSGRFFSYSGEELPW